ncbi:enoyl-CoA hydratase [Pseudorhodoferax sp. Leaf267]|uniref:enoyl-CoA hydratase n=1 Tax=Pseudorhodoferax sp. Leaf267 TaxID=1736316 RepID=UPI0006FBD61A|nr:enoyl-CoA hydratase [Pseudorhodoferax sp. Leaf267]KQP13142.1 enoyl-CoA hydratase [Pseudorhodoferax sp. Leaf267]
MTIPTELLQLSTPHPGCVCLTLNRPQAMNALSRALRQELADSIDQLATDASLRVLVLTGAGRAFCAGLDLREIDGSALGGNEADPVAALLRFPRPVIGAINGAAITGGLELALACDVLIASTEARFADTHARVGVIPGWGLSQKLPRLIGIARAKEMAFSGNFVGAEQAERWGLVNRVVAPEELLPQTFALAADMAGALPDMVLAYKQLIDEGFAGTLGDGLVMERARSRDWAAVLTADALRARGAAVQARGRTQAP